MIRRLALLVVAAVACPAHEPITTRLTWTREISRIFLKRCMGCHREGGGAMSLAAYDEARPWAKAIRDEVLERRMPPWGAVKGFGEFRDDPSLSEVEIDWIANWVEGGAPKGEDLYLPAGTAAAARNPAKPPIRGLALPLTLARQEVVFGIEPAIPGKIVARRPDGAVAPLIWLLHLRPDQPKAFYFREPLKLPRGTTIEGGGRLITSAGSPAW